MPTRGSAGGGRRHPPGGRGVPQPGTVGLPAHRVQGVGRGGERRQLGAGSARSPRGPEGHRVRLDEPRQQPFDRLRRRGAAAHQPAARPARDRARGDRPDVGAGHAARLPRDAQGPDCPHRPGDELHADVAGRRGPRRTSGPSRASARCVSSAATGWTPPRSRICEPWRRRSAAARPPIPKRSRSGSSGQTFEPGSRNELVEVVNARDEARILREVRNAVKLADYVLVTSHSHEPGNDAIDSAEWLRTFAKACHRRWRRGLPDPRSASAARHRDLQGSADLLQSRQLRLPERDHRPDARRPLRAVRPAADGPRLRFLQDARFKGGTVGFPASPVWYRERRRRPRRSKARRSSR